jgi:uncharacterized protein YdeI (YjbR/CyaY-like superfamily)
MTSPTFFESAEAFGRWLEANAASEKELLVGFRKVGSGLPSLTWSESVDEALRFGWIDGVRRSIDEQSYSIRFTPRKPTSIWSAINIAKVEKLRTEGRMTPAGEKAYALRKAHLSAIYSHEQPTSAELTTVETRAFKREKAAWKYFETTPPGYKKVVFHWVTTAKRAETRASRLAKLIQACAEGRRLGW